MLGLGSPTPSPPLPLKQKSRHLWPAFLSFLPYWSWQPILPTLWATGLGWGPKGCKGSTWPCELWPDIIEFESTTSFNGAREREDELSHTMYLSSLPHKSSTPYIYRFVVRLVSNKALARRPAGNFMVQVRETCRVIVATSLLFWWSHQMSGSKGLTKQHLVNVFIFAAIAQGRWTNNLLRGSSSQRGLSLPQSWWAKGWPPPDSMGFRWKSPSSSASPISWTHHHACTQDAACVVSGKATRPIKATGSWKLPVVWQGPEFLLSIALVSGFF